MARRGLVVGSALGVTGLFLAVVTAVVSSASDSSQVSSAGRPQAANRAFPDTAIPRKLTDAVALYPRVIRLEHAGQDNGRLIAAVVSHSGQSGVAEFFESRDDGATFTPTGTISDVTAAGGRGLCCGTLFEVPQQLGRTPEGALLWAASTGQGAADRRMAIRVWRSLDGGHDWSYLSACAVAADRRGLWEPELSVDAAGQLVCHFSDETQQPRHSQVLARVASFDGGVTWGPREDTVVAAKPTDRPGMAVVRRLPYGVYVMSYEMCSPGARHMCPVHFRTSADGWNWGPPLDPGPLVETGDSSYFEHAPTLTWTSGAGLYGRLFVVGQLVTSNDGSTSAASGRTVFYNDQRGTGPWYRTAAPVPMRPSPYDTCSNYSSALLPSQDGSRLLEIATRYDSDGVCRAYYATVPVRPL